jgi:hypothetical protein
MLLQVCFQAFFHMRVIFVYLYNLFQNIKLQLHLEKCYTRINI